MHMSTDRRPVDPATSSAIASVRQAAIDAAYRACDSGEFLGILRTLVGFRTESRSADRGHPLRDYLSSGISPLLRRLGFVGQIIENDVSPAHPVLIARRITDPDRPTLLIYGHADVQPGQPEQWRTGLDPWRIVVDGDRWYGRGVADNKGQHLVNLIGLEQVLRERQGDLGYNVTVLLETGEEIGSPGLEQICAGHRDLLQADLFLGSDGPRVSEDQPTVFLGSRGIANFTLTLDLRDDAHHSGNWGGLLRNPVTVLANAIAGVIDSNGQLKVERLRARRPPEAVRQALADIEPGTGGPPIDAAWGEPSLTPAERLFASNTMEVFTIGADTPGAVVHSIPGRATARCQLRLVPELDPSMIEPVLRQHLDEQGLADVEVSVTASMPATRLDPDNPWVGFAMDSLHRTSGKRPALIPGIGGTLPNVPFARTLGLPTLWIPHSYPGCAQHAPNEHLPQGLVREALGLMAGLFSDLADLKQWPPARAVPETDS